MRKLYLLMLIGLVGCNSDYSPKPIGYFRIGLPEKEYTSLNEEGCPYTFDLNTSSDYKAIANRDCWGDIVYPGIDATVQLTYHSLKSRKLEDLLKEGQRMAYSHTIKADGMKEHLFLDEKKRVYGVLYQMQGQVATSTQFYLTDSTDNFLRGVLYFYSSPNPDSLKTVNAFMQGEIVNMIESLEWKNG